MKYVFAKTEIYEVEAVDLERAFNIMSDPFDAEPYLVDTNLEFKGEE